MAVPLRVSGHISEDGGVHTGTNEDAVLMGTTGR
ncbi:hypothetical protein QFZ30_001556 [Arthrobacter pascens]|nr:hypothetical protein [Arthrobacter pascens]